MLNHLSVFLLFRENIVKVFMFLKILKSKIYLKKCINAK